MDGTTDSLFEKWFYCDDLGVQLVPVIKEFFASEQYRTGRPLPGTIPQDPPYRPDEDRRVENPFNLNDWLQSNKDGLGRDGCCSLFERSRYGSDIVVYGQGFDLIPANSHEIWLWQLVNVDSTSVLVISQSLIISSIRKASLE